MRPLRTQTRGAGPEALEGAGVKRGGKSARTRSSRETEAPRLGRPRFGMGSSPDPRERLFARMARGTLAPRAGGETGKVFPRAKPSLYPGSECGTYGGSLDFLLEGVRGLSELLLLGEEGVDAPGRLLADKGRLGGTDSVPLEITESETVTLWVSERPKVPERVLPVEGQDPELRGLVLRSVGLTDEPGLLAPLREVGAPTGGRETGKVFSRFEGPVASPPGG